VIRPAVERILARGAYEVMSLAAPYPAVALSSARVRRHGVLVGPGTDLLVEGYPRSGNSFAVSAFGLSRAGGMRIAHHTHAPAHVIAAVRLGVPALVLIRDPRDAVVDFVGAKPALSAGQALRGWVRFYHPLLRYRHGFVVARSEELTRDFGAVVRRLNERFGTAFAELERTADVERRIREGTEEYWRGRRGRGLPVLGRGRGGEAGPAGSPQGSPEALREHVRTELESPRLARRCATARAMYRALTTAGR